MALGYFLGHMTGLTAELTALLVVADDDGVPEDLVVEGAGPTDWMRAMWNRIGSQQNYGRAVRSTSPCIMLHSRAIITPRSHQSSWRIPWRLDGVRRRRRALTVEGLNPRWFSKLAQARVCPRATTRVRVPIVERRGPRSE